MKKYDAIEEGIKKQDVQGLQTAIATICYLCKDFSDGEFDAALAYVKKQGINIIDPTLKGTLVSEGKTKFEDDDFTRAVFELKKNFCNERINDVKYIGKTLYKKSEPKPKPPKDPNGDGTVPKESSHQKKKIVLVILVAIILIIIFMILKQSSQRSIDVVLSRLV